jgi:hypothetical protein
MKTPLQRLLSTLAFILSISALSAQIPNGGFESWVNMGGYSEPAGWLTYNDVSTVVGATVEQGTPGNPGAFHAVLTTREATGGGIPIHGWISAGTSGTHSGFPFIARPAMLTGQWQYGIQPLDTAQVIVALSKWNTITSSTDPIAYGSLEITGNVTGWQAFVVPITYYSADAPDTAYIQIVSSINFQNPVVGSFVKVDDLAFAGEVGLPERTRAHLHVFPSPAANSLHIASSGSGELRLFDASGREVLRSRITGTTATLDVSLLPAGFYTYRFLTNDDGSSVVGRWVKE